MVYLKIWYQRYQVDLLSNMFVIFRNLTIKKVQIHRSLIKELFDGVIFLLNFVNLNEETGPDILHMLV